MFKNYFKTSLRGLIKTPLSSLINIVGLSIAIGICVFAYAFARWTYSTDQFHKDKNEVFLVTFMANRQGAMQQFGQTPRPLGEMLKADFTHIRKVCRLEDRSVVVKYQDNVFHERVRFVEPEFLDMMTFPLKWGTSRSLADVNSVILSAEMSFKYFGEENPVGQTLLVKFDKDRSKAFKVTGVAAAFPTAHTIDFNFLINFENLRTADPDYDFHDWSALVNATLVQFDNADALSSVERGMDKYRALQNKAVDEGWGISSFVFERLATLNERTIKNSISSSSEDNYKTILFLCVISVFMMALACFNYINIAIVSAAKRLKEIGVRKTIGATRRIVVVQFLSENIVVTFFAMVAGLILAAVIFIPGFESMWHFDMGFTLKDANLWIYLPAILLFTAVASGLYPAVYISRFEVVKILKGSVQFGKKNPLTKLFLGIQLVLTCLFLTGAVMFTQNSSYLAHRSWGYNPGTALYVNVPDLAAFEQLSAVMARDPNVVSIAGSLQHLGKSHATRIIGLPGHRNEVDQLAVDAHYFETMGLHLRQGRIFKDRSENDKRAVVVNEIFTKKVELESSSANQAEWPIGQLFKIDSIQYEIVGVVSDFHSYSFKNNVLPTFFRAANRADYRYLSLKVRPGAEKQTYLSLQAQWAKLFPETPFQGGYQEDVWGNFFVEQDIYATVMETFGSIALLLASLGLYGLMTLNVTGRIKEFSIRKVLGAGIHNIAAVITRQYVLLFAVALAIGAPISFILVRPLVEGYPYHMPITLSGVGIAVSILIGVLLTTVSTQVRKVTQTNPVNGLKTE